MLGIFVGAFAAVFATVIGWAVGDSFSSFWTLLNGLFIAVIWPLSMAWVTRRRNAASSK